MGSKRFLFRSHLIFGLLFLIFGLTAPLPSIPIKLQQIFGLTSFAIIFWVFQPITIEQTSFILIFGFLLTNLVKIESIILGLSSKTLWLVISGMAISISVIELKFTTKVAQLLGKHLPTSLTGLVIQMHLLGLLTALIVPSGIVRVILLFPIGNAIAEQYSECQQVELKKIILLSLTLSTIFGGFGFLTGAVPNMISSGLFTAITNIPVTWSSWLLWMSPSVGLLRTITSVLIILIIFSRNFGELFKKKNTNKDDRSFDNKQIRGMIIIACCILGLITDSIHRHSPLHVCLLTMAFIFSHPIGPLSFKFIKNLNFGFLFYLFSLFVLGDAAEASGLMVIYKNLIIDFFKLLDSSPIQRYGFTMLSALPLSFFMDVAAVAVLLTPVVLDLSNKIGMEPYPAMMTLSLGTSIVFFPYQAAPLMYAFSSGSIPKQIFIKLLVLISIISLCVIYPFTLLVWSLFDFI